MGMNIMRMKGRAKMMRTIKVTGKGKIAVKRIKSVICQQGRTLQEYEDTPKVNRRYRASQGFV